MTLHILIGTKAELIKMAGVLKELDRQKIKYNFVHTGQHTKKGLELIKIFGLKKPDLWITKRKEDLKTPSEALIWAAKGVIKGKFSGIFKKGDIIVVHGDTESTLMGAVIAKLCGCKLMHVEGGLRSFDIFNPFPEEINRRITDRFSSVIFCPDEWACSNVQKYKNKAEIINLGINPVIDAINFSIGKTKPASIPKGKYSILMLHRKETLYVKNKLNIALDILEKIINKMPTIFILSKNSEHVLKKVGFLDKIKNNPNVMIRDYYDYVTFMSLVNKSEFVAADSGGIQEETYLINKPYLILREKTERQEGLGETALLSKLDINKVNYFLDNYKKFRRKKKIGKASPSKIIVKKLKEVLANESSKN